MHLKDLLKIKESYQYANYHTHKMPSGKYQGAPIIDIYRTNKNYFMYMLCCGRLDEDTLRCFVHLYFDYETEILQNYSHHQVKIKSGLQRINELKPDVLKKLYNISKSFDGEIPWHVFSYEHCALMFFAQIYQNYNHRIFKLNQPEYENMKLCVNK